MNERYESAKKIYAQVGIDEAVMKTLKRSPVYCIVGRVTMLVGSILEGALTGEFRQQETILEKQEHQNSSWMTLKRSSLWYRARSN